MFLLTDVATLLTDVFAPTALHDVATLLVSHLLMSRHSSHDVFNVEALS